MNMDKRHANAICIICGNGYYKQPSKTYTKCCSEECKKQYIHNQGKFVLELYCKEMGSHTDYRNIKNSVN